MSNFQNLKNEIIRTIRENGNQEITGDLLQEKLLEMVNSLGQDYKFRGVATPDSQPTTDDTNVFYVANTVGSYPYYGGLSVADGEIAFFTYDSSWSKITISELSQELGDRKDVGVSQKCVKESIRNVDASLRDTLGMYVENPEYLRAYTDKNGVFLWGIKRDGSIEFAKGVPTPIKNYIEAINQDLSTDVSDINNILVEAIDRLNLIDGTFFTISNEEFLYAILDSNDKVLFGITKEGNVFIANTIKSESLSLIESFNDKENRLSIVLSKDGKILSYIDENGTKHESNLIVEDTFLLKENALELFKKQLRDSGFSDDNIFDWSKESYVQIPMPSTCAKVNIIAERLPVSKVDDINGILEFWDKNGNYFKKPIILNAQGSSSMAYELKNLSVDINDGSKIKIGGWVSQDSFHLKVYYIDVFRGINNINYNYAEQIIQYMGCRSNRFAQGETTIYDGTGILSSDFNRDALCHPDGFPIEIYLNGEYLGLYSWNIKKHRANYMQNKNDATSTILDGYLDGSTFFGGNINWTQFELRNPKELATMDGREYDADTNCDEIMDETSEYYDDSKISHINSATIKPIIQKVANALGHIATLSSVEDKRAYFEEVFDKNMMICYFIVSNVVDNWDAFAKNWIWTIYKGGKAAPNFYDMDSCYGRWFTGTHIKSGADINSILGIGPNLPTKVLHDLYLDEIKAVYSELRGKGLITVEYIMSYFDNWIKRVGFDAYERNIEKNLNIPSYRNSYINSEYWSFDRVSGNEVTYSSSANYNVGDIVYYGMSRFYKFTCIKPCTGVAPISQFYPTQPHELGMFDTPMRVKKWLEDRISFLDNYFNV